MTVKILTHGDTDGLCAGALAYARYPEGEVWFTHPAGLLNDLKDVDAEIVIICDVAISEGDKNKIFSQFTRISGSGELLYIDHHPLPLETLSGDLPCTQVVRDRTKSASELTFRFFEAEIPPELNRVALFGAISDYCDETKFIRDELDIYDKRTIYLEAGLLSQCLNEARGNPNYKREVLYQLANGAMPSEIDGVVEKAMKSTEKEWDAYSYVHRRVEVVDGIAIVKNVPRGISPTKVAKFSMGIAGKDIGIGLKFKKDFADLGVRKRGDFPLDLNRVLRTIAPRFGGTGGGHPTAGGARIPKEHLDEFISAFAKEISAII
ncbi:MAG: DHHA1 domain-containing protein [Candidatus Hydrothermarchaeales archaeon]